jgi:site-specific DNA recombinase
VSSPQCGRRYIGTAARGRYKTYRYYTCWSRARYGTAAGCDIHRLNADDLETAIGDALLDFYTTGTDIITKAAAEFQQQHATATIAHRERLATVTPGPARGHRRHRPVPHRLRERHPWSLTLSLTLTVGRPVPTALVARVALAIDCR